MFYVFEIYIKNLSGRLILNVRTVGNINFTYNRTCTLKYKKKVHCTNESNLSDETFIDFKFHQCTYRTSIQSKHKFYPKNCIMIKIQFQININLSRGNNSNLHELYFAHIVENSNRNQS